MTEVLVPDAGGSTLKLMDYGGKRYRCFFFRPETLESSHSLPLRPDDILLCSYPKAGCHWAWEITRTLLDGNTKEVNGIQKEDAMLENVSLPEAEALASPRLLNTHMQFSELPKDLIRHRNKVIFVYRNPKDVAVSFYHLHKSFAHYEYNGKFDDYLSLYLSGNVDWGSFYDYFIEWDKVIKDNEFNLPFHVVAYENLKMNPMNELRRLSVFLEKDYDDKFLESVLDVCSFTKMKNRKGAIHVGKDGETIMYRKGVVGDWKNHFTVSRNEEIDRMIREKIPDIQFQFIYE